MPDSPQARLLVQHRDEIIRIAERRGFTNIRVFGSVARGDTRPDSDIDLMADFIDLHGLRTSLLDLIGLEREIAELIEVHVDVVPARSLKPYVQAETSREAVAL